MNWVMWALLTSWPSVSLQWILYFFYHTCINFAPMGRLLGTLCSFFSQALFTNKLDSHCAHLSFRLASSLVHHHRDKISCAYAANEMKNPLNLSTLFADTSWNVLSRAASQLLCSLLWVASKISQRLGMSGVLAPECLCYRQLTIAWRSLDNPFLDNPFVWLSGHFS